MDRRSLHWLCGWAALATLALAWANPNSPVAWQAGIEVARGRGERGPWQQSQSRYDYVDDPAVAIDERGDAVVAWADQAKKAIFFQRFAAGDAKPSGPPVDVSRLPDTFSWLPRIALAPGAPHKVFILWQEIIFSGGSHGGDILFAQSDDAGKSFSPPQNLTRSVGGEGKGRINREVWHNGSHDLIAGADGTLYAAWTEYDGALWFTRSGDGGRSFSPPRAVVAGGQALPARAPSLAAGPDGAVYLAWSVGEDNAGDVQLLKSTDGGATFGPPQAVAPSKTYSDAPRLAVDPRGTLHMVYAESDGGPFGRYHVRYTRSADGARSFDAPRAISAPAPDASAGAAFPALSVDARGRLYVLWELTGGGRQPPRGLGLAVSRDGGQTFSTPSVVPGSADAGGGFNGSSQGLTKKLVVSPTGEVAIVNSSLLPNRLSRIWLMRGALKQLP